MGHSAREAHVRLTPTTGDLNRIDARLDLETERRASGVANALATGFLDNLINRFGLLPDPPMTEAQHILVQNARTAAAALRNLWTCLPPDGFLGDTGELYEDLVITSFLAYEDNGALITPTDALIATRGRSPIDALRRHDAWPPDPPPAPTAEHTASCHPGRWYVRLKSP